MSWLLLGPDELFWIFPRCTVAVYSLGAGLGSLGWSGASGISVYLWVGWAFCNLWYLGSRGLVDADSWPVVGLWSVASLLLIIGAVMFVYLQ